MRKKRSGFIDGVHGVRYQVKDVARSVAFYTEKLRFTLQHQELPAFANVSLGGSQILLSGPGASGSRPMPNGRQQEPGGWNRVVLKVTDLAGFIMEAGQAGRQIQIEDHRFWFGLGPVDGPDRPAGLSIPELDR